MAPSISTRNLVSEFIGTYLLVLTVGCNVLSENGTFAALSIASVLMVMVYALGGVSGACFNPAVAFAVFLHGAMDAATFGAYFVTELIGGSLAGLTYTMMFGKAVPLAPGAGYHWGGACVAEVLYTFMLCFVVLRTAVSSAHRDASNEFYGLAIGFVIVAGGYAAGGISGGAFNPAVAFGLDLSSAGMGFGWCFAYTAYELIGAALAFGLNKIVEKKDTAGVFVAEFLGTFFLIFTVGLNVLGKSPAAALSIAASLMCMIYALGGISGAHFNPAVTAAIVLAGKHEGESPAVYIGAQLSGAVAAGLSYMALVGKAFPLGPGKSYSMIDAAVAEIVYTFVLCFVVLNTACLSGSRAIGDGGAAKHIYGLAIGFCVVVGGFAIGSVSGGSLNPAVSVGIDTANAVKGGKFMNCLLYSLFELVGAGAAAGAFRVVRSEAGKAQ